MKKNMTFEQAMTRLEEIAQTLETGDIAIEDSIKFYEEGIRLIRFCEGKLNEAQKKVRKLSRSAEGDFETQPLDEAETGANSDE